MKLKDYLREKNGVSKIMDLQTLLGQSANTLITLKAFIKTNAPDKNMEKMINDMLNKINKGK